MICDTKRVAYARIPAEDLLYSSCIGERGLYSGRVQTLFLRVRFYLKEATNCRSDGLFFIFRHPAHRINHGNLQRMQKFKYTFGLEPNNKKKKFSKIFHADSICCHYHYPSIPSVFAIIVRRELKKPQFFEIFVDLFRKILV